MEHDLLQAFGQFGVVAFGLIALFCALLILKIRKSKGATLVLDEQALQYGGIRIPWPLMREPIVCKSLGRSYVGIRTVNDQAMVAKMNQTLGKHMGPTLLGLNYVQGQAQCSVLITRLDGLTTDELQKLIEQYRSAFHESKATEAITAP